MKECKYCRTKYDDNLSACPSCGGTKVITAQEKAEDAALYQKEIENRERAIAEPGIRKKRVFGVIAAIIAVVIVGVVAISYNTNKPLSNGMTKDEGETILAEGIAFYDEGDYESAIACFVQLPSDSKQYEEAQSMLEKCENEYSSSIVEKANGYAENGEYEMAINLLNNAGNILPNNAAISAAHNAIFAEYKGIICGDAYSEAEVYVSNGDYPSAIATIDNAVELVGHDDELAARKKVYIDAYVMESISRAETQYVEYDSECIEKSIQIIKSALEIVSGDTRLTSALDFYMENSPTGILSLPCYYDSDDLYVFTDIGDAVDSKGTSYDDVIALHAFTWIEIDYQYSRLTGIYFQNQEYKNSPVKHKLKIYGEQEYSYWGADNLIWEGTVNGSSDPIDIDVDISNYKWLEFVISEWDFDEHSYISDLQVWK